MSPTDLTCPDGEFLCQFEGRCIPNFYLCDRYVDCLMTTDEMNCPGEFTGCATGEIRLTNGLTSNEGRVEICINGTFGVITNEEFGVQEASVVCRNLGLSGLEGRMHTHTNLASANKIGETGPGSKTDIVTLTSGIGPPSPQYYGM